MTLLTSMGASVPGLLMIVFGFLVILTIVVFVHEMGHFLVGRWCGVGVQVFSIGFGKELLGFNDRHGTRWKFCAVPLGGYVKFVGDANGASVPDPAALAAMSPHERAISFPTRPVAKRAAIVAAGPIANFILALVIFAGSIYVIGRPEVPARVEGVRESSAAQRAGFQIGDVIQTIDGSPITTFEDIKRVVIGSAGSSLTVGVKRGDETVDLTAVPDSVEQKTRFGTYSIGQLGLEGPKPSEMRLVRYGIIDSLRLGVGEMTFLVQNTFNYLGKLVSGRESPNQLSGPIGIARISGAVVETGDIATIIGWIGSISLSIGLLNLFPIPILDGGHLLFYGFEALRGRPLSERTQEIGFRIGIAFLLMLMLLATFNDVFTNGFLRNAS